MNEFFEEEEYDGIDDNVEILLEDAQADPNQAYVYIRIKANPDEEQLVVRVEEEGTMMYTPNTDMVSVLSNGTEAQLAMCFLELFQMDPIFLDAVMAAIQSLSKTK